MKRNQWVVAVVLAALALMLWSGYANYKRRKRIAAVVPASMGYVPGSGGNQSVQQDVAGDEGLPHLQGRLAPEFTLQNVEGKKVSLADYRGKAVLINFWATWCTPCKIEMPWLIALHNQYAHEGFEILGVSEDDSSVTRAQIAKFGQQQGINYPLLVGTDAVSRKYGDVEFLPTSYFVGRDGKVVSESAGLVAKDQIEADIKKALAAGGKKAK
ncbi:MAG TPA: TlpA disulfide reductase family protein [Acidobacteriaceae bacterium]|nr:TlpA disulfide reductase family protein [Acidobacteriaceae bacterium]